MTPSEQVKRLEARIHTVFSVQLLLRYDAAQVAAAHLRDDLLNAITEDMLELGFTDQPLNAMWEIVRGLTAVIDDIALASLVEPTGNGWYDAPPEKRQHHKLVLTYKHPAPMPHVIFIEPQAAATVKLILQRQ